eukprot:719811-Prorocentrum_minimum.AAC.1
MYPIGGKRLRNYTPGAVRAHLGKVARQLEGRAQPRVQLATCALSLHRRIVAAEDVVDGPRGVLQALRAGAPRKQPARLVEPIALEERAYARGASHSRKRRERIYACCKPAGGRLQKHDTERPRVRGEGVQPPFAVGRVRLRGGVGGRARHERGA